MDFLEVYPAGADGYWYFWLMVFPLQLECLYPLPQSQLIHRAPASSTCSLVS